MKGTKIWVKPRGFGEQGKKGIYFKDTGGQRPNFKEKGGTQTILYPQGNKGTGTPWEYDWLKRQISFHANSEGSGESAHLSLAWAYISEQFKNLVLAQMAN